MKKPLLTLRDAALPEPQFRRLLRAIRGLKDERLSSTYQTTFWFPLGTEPSNLVEEAVLSLRPLIPMPKGVTGVEWWLSRMRTDDVRVDFHQDRDEKLALAGGPLKHPAVSSLLYLNAVKGGALVVTEQLPDEENPSLAPQPLDGDLAAPKRNRLVHFAGNLTHGVLDAGNGVPGARKSPRGSLRLAVVMNWWDRQPTDLRSFKGGRIYRGLRSA